MTALSSWRLSQSHKHCNVEYCRKSLPVIQSDINKKNLLVFLCFSLNLSKTGLYRLEIILELFIFKGSVGKVDCVVISCPFSSALFCHLGSMFPCHSKLMSYFLETS